MGFLDFKVDNKKDLYLSLFLICLVILVVFSFNEYKGIKAIIDSYNTQNLDETLDIEREIKANGGLYTRAPLGKSYEYESNQAQVYSILSYNSSWRIHRIVGALIKSGRFLFLVVGLIFSKYKFKRNKKLNFREQLMALGIFTSISLLLEALFGFLLLYMMDKKYLLGSQLINSVDRIYLSLNVWKPGFFYILLSLLFMILVFSAYAIVGFLLGTYIKRNIVGIIVYILISPLLYLYPISPIYFLRQMGKYFLVPTNTFLYSQSGSVLDIFLYLIFMLLYIFLAYLHLIKNK